MNTSLESFVELLLQISEQRISESAANAWLNRAIEQVENDYLVVQELCQETGYDQESPDEVEAGLLALEDYREALGLVEDYFLDGGSERLEAAAFLATAVQEQMQTAMAYNQDASTGLRLELVC